MRHPLIDLYIDICGYTCEQHLMITMIYEKHNNRPSRGSWHRVHPSGMLFIMTATHGWLNGESHPQSTSTNGRTQGFERFSYCIYLNLSTLCIYIYIHMYLHIFIYPFIES